MSKENFRVDFLEKRYQISNKICKKIINKDPGLNSFDADLSNNIIIFANGETMAFLNEKELIEAIVDSITLYGRFENPFSIVSDFKVNDIEIIILDDKTYSKPEAKIKYKNKIEDAKTEYENGILLSDGTCIVLDSLNDVNKVMIGLNNDIYDRNYTMKDVSIITINNKSYLNYEIVISIKPY